MAKSKTKIHTIGKIGIAFFTTLTACEDFKRDIETKILYSGLLDSNAIDEVAKEVVEIHPDFAKYFEIAMMPLYKTYGSVTKGTESPRYAIKTLRTEKEIKAKSDYVVIWEIMELEKSYTFEEMEHYAMNFGLLVGSKYMIDGPWRQTFRRMVKGEFKHLKEINVA